MGCIALLKPLHGFIKAELLSVPKVTSPCPRWDNRGIDLKSVRLVPIL